MDKNSLLVRIENLRVWKSNNWVKHHNKMTSNAFLRLHYDQLVITSENKVLETINLRSKLKGVYKEDYVILMLNIFGNEIRKIKFQIMDNVEQNLQELAKKFPLVPYNMSSSCNTQNIKFQSTEDILKGILDKEGNLPTLPPSPTLDSFLKLCILDPLFPQTVLQVEKLIAEKMLHKS